MTRPTGHPVFSIPPEEPPSWPLALDSGNSSEYDSELGTSNFPRSLDCYMSKSELPTQSQLLKAPLSSRQMSQGAQQTFLIQNPTMNSPNAVATPVELNRNLLKTLFKFNPMSRLKIFLITKTGVEKPYYSLKEILTSLKNIIREEGLFDHANPSIILCSKELEEALNMKAFHVT